MRLLTRKIYRAFPELDQFDDDTCKRYVKRAKEQEADRGCVLLMIVVFVSVIAWVAGLGGLVFTATKFVIEFVFFQRSSTGFTSDCASLVSTTGIIWFPWFTTLLTRDIWLWNSVRDQIITVRCSMCKYSLMGLPIQRNENFPYVDCPECGQRIMLYDNGLAEADIDPTLLSS